MTTDVVGTTSRPLPSSATSPGVVVGVDGSDGSLRAVAWAAAEAATRSLPLTVLYAADGDRPHARRLLDHARTTALRCAPGLLVTTALVETDPVAALTSVSRFVHTLVVGFGERGRCADPIVGSSAVEVAARATGRVVVVRRTGSVDGPVIALMDRGHEDPHVLGEARSAAGPRGTVPVVSVVTPGSAAAALAGSDGAALVVVSRAGGARFALGPLARSAIRSAGCPVLIVPAGRPVEVPPGAPGSVRAAGVSRR